MKVHYFVSVKVKGGHPRPGVSLFKEGSLPVMPPKGSSIDFNGWFRGKVLDSSIEKALSPEPYISLSLRDPEPLALEDVKVLLDEGWTWGRNSD